MIVKKNDKNFQFQDMKKLSFLEFDKKKFVTSAYKMINVQIKENMMFVKNSGRYLHVKKYEIILKRKNFCHLVFHKKQETHVIYLDVKDTF